MALLKALCWALIFIIRIRFPPGTSLARPKALTYQSPGNISDMFKLCNSQRNELRSDDNRLMLSKPKTNSMKRTFAYA